MAKITIQDFLHRLNAKDPDVFKDFVENLAIALYHPEPPEWGHTYECGHELSVELDSDNEIPSGADVLGQIHNFFFEQALLGTPGPRMPTYTVVGIYADNNQRYCDDFTAWSPTNAEAQARAQAEADGNELIIAGVFLNGKPCIPDGEGRSDV
jgi:hypothetical protein